MSRVGESAWGDTPLGALQSIGDYPAGVPHEVCTLFERFALEAIRSGLKHYSSDALCHRIRWFCVVEQRMGDFKINNNVTPVLARWFMRKHSQYADFFETRVRKSLCAESESTSL